MVNFDYDCGYSKGCTDTWEAAKKVILPVDEGGLMNTELREIFGMTSFTSILRNYSAAGAMAKIADYEKTHKFKPGYIVKNINNSSFTMLVTYIGKQDGLLYGLDCSNGCSCSGKDPDRFVDTGKRVDLSLMFAQMKDNQN